MENTDKKSSRTFNLMIGCGFIVYGLFGQSAMVVTWLALGVSVSMMGYFFPKLLWPFFLLWMQLGKLLHSIMSPILLFIVFYLVITPIGMLMRLFNATSIDKKTYLNDMESYWLAPQENEYPSTMEKQF